MTEQPGREPEQRLPAPREPATAAPVDRFTAPPANRKFELTPERAAQIVRQSSNARWIGFLAVIVVVLFVAVYWFYELGAPLGITQARLDKELDAQQVTAVERGYNLYEANCARCHGANGEGGIGPTLNRQDKLFAHLNENYIRNVLTVGGRYVCGNPNSQMPVWSDKGNPPGPLNYVQIDELIAFLRAPNTQTFEVRDPSLNEPVNDPTTGKVKTFTGWRDPNYKPAPGATPYPDCWADEFTKPAASGGAGGSASPAASGGGSAAPSAPAASGAAAGETIKIVAQGIQFTTQDVKAKAGSPFSLEFDNEDASVPHNVQIKDPTGTPVFTTDTITGVTTKTFQVPALQPGSYPFICTIHPNMTGTLTVQ